MKQTSPENFFKFACIFESSLILVALVLAAIFDINPLELISFNESAVFFGIVGVLPLLLFFAALYHMDYEPMRKIKHIMLDTMGSGMQNLHWVDLLVLAAIAGVSEELLFRGVLQPWMEMKWGFASGLLVSNLIFGLVHAVTPLYAVLAGLVGVYLGLAMDYGEQRNLLTPIIIHGLYDFLAFLAIMAIYRKQMAGEQQ